MAVYGQDWSANQPAKPSTTGLSFAIVKATEGHTYTSPVQVEQAAHARAAGLVVGFYHFLWPGNIETQAEYFVTQCASVEGDLLACDWEITTDGTAATGAEKDAFLAAVRRLRPQHKVLLYCNRSFWLDRDTTSDCGDGLWIADPSSPAGHPAVKHAWTIHQYSEAGGIDRDLANFSTEAGLRSWARARLSNTARSTIPQPSSEPTPARPPEQPPAETPAPAPAPEPAPAQGAQHSVLGAVKRGVEDVVHTVEAEVSSLLHREPKSGPGPRPQSAPAPTPEERGDGADSTDGSNT
ncbi:GH25 family lysozyme [Phaeacidiphilus oryzae]|uniref:GH25 family lysozyme n=1 Tax=Phaeacidiphilus oryzae TaxID=348818 RepID=UPI0007C70A5A|nr:GH25 family lysozyme [Phaeacidiphilus oryzae]